MFRRPRGVYVFLGCLRLIYIPVIFVVWDKPDAYVWWTVASIDTGCSHLGCTYLTKELQASWSCTVLDQSMAARFQNAFTYFEVLRWKCLRVQRLYLEKYPVTSVMPSQI